MTKFENEETGWKKYFDEPTRRLFYKQDDTSPIMSVITDCIIDHDLSYVLACMAELEFI